MRKIIPSVVVGCVLGILVVAPFLDRSIPYTRENGRVEPVDSSEIVRGKEVEVVFDAIVWRRCPGRATRHIIDGAGIDHDYATHVAIIPTLTHDDPIFRIRFILPMSTPEALGKDWHFYADMEYWCNWTQRLIWPIRERTPIVPFRPVR